MKKFIDNHVGKLALAVVAVALIVVSIWGHTTREEAVPEALSAPAQP